ncbi:MAG: carboxypeptidase-like regulatory domain-containing protein, partial [Imperialibacter sp.]
MKTIKLNFLLVIMALGVFTFTSCEDEFTEEDFLDKQAELAAAQQSFDLEKLILEYELMRENDSLMRVFQAELANIIRDENAEALRQAGLLSSYTVTVENQGGAPLEGVTVSVGGSNPAARVDALTDATGQVIIEDIVIGASPVQVTLTGFVGVSYILDLGNINFNDDYHTIGDRVYPLGRRETSRITLLSADGASGTFGTVKGTATIEVDVTNLTPEIPQDVTIVAYLNGTSYSGGSPTSFYNSSVTMSDFRFIGEGIGSAVVDNATGAWSMLLPATEGGITYNFQLPTITADQRIAIDERDEVAIAPEYATVPTMFGPAAGSYDYVNPVSGATAVFTAAPAQGTGFGLTYTQVARALDAGVNTGTGQNNTFVNNTDVSVGADVYRMTSRGSALSTSPTATADGGNGTGTDATFTTAIFGRITAIGIAAAGTGFAVNDQDQMTVTPQNATPANTATDINNDGTAFDGVNDGVNLQFIVTVTTIGGGGT